MSALPPVGSMFQYELPCLGLTVQRYFPFVMTVVTSDGLVLLDPGGPATAVVGERFDKERPPRRLSGEDGLGHRLSLRCGSDVLDSPSLCGSCCVLAGGGLACGWLARGRVAGIAVAVTGMARGVGTGAG